jgi:hypothetical protein
MAGVRRYRDDGDGLGDGGIWGSGVAEMDGVAGGIYSGDTGVDSLHRILYLISSHTILSYDELYTPSFASFDLTRSFRDFVWIRAIAWILAAG